LDYYKFKLNSSKIYSRFGLKNFKMFIYFVTCLENEIKNLIKINFIN